MTDGEVVLHRVERVELSEARRDLFRGAPARVVSRRQAQVLRDAVHVRVHRDDELGRRDVPQPEVDTVRWADHPAQVEEQPLGRASRARIGDQVLHRSRGVGAAERVREARETFAKIAGLLEVVRERFAQAPMPADRRARRREQRGQVFASVDAMNESIETARERPLASPHREVRRFAERAEGAVDAGADGHDVAESEGRGDEPHHLAVVGRGSMHERDRVGGDVTRRIVALEQRVEACRECPGPPRARSGRSPGRRGCLGALAHDLWYSSSVRPLALAILALALALAAPSASAQVPFRKGPYLMDARTDQVAILFELGAAAPATVIVTQPAAGEEATEVSRIESPSSDFHEVVVTGLEPQNRYDYRVVVGESVREGTFTTAPPPGEGPVRFLVVGDNRTNAQAHAAVIARMREHPGDFVINTGDMVASGADPEDWQELFDVEGELLRDTPLFPALGNHELYRFGVGLPSFLRYTRVPDAHGGAETYYAFDWGPVRVLMLDSNDDWSNTEAEQRRWLVERLEEASHDETVAHLMVALHQGPMSSNHHGGHADMLSTGVVHLFRRYGVALVLSGHDHGYERGDWNGVKYIVTGGGGAPLYHENHPLPFQHRFDASFHFLEVDASRERVDLTARRVDDSVIERCGFERGGRWTCEREDGQSVPSEPVAPDSTEEPVRRSGRSRTLLFLVGGLALLAVVFGLFLRKRGRARG